MSQFEYKEPVPSDIDIAQAATLKPIRDVAAQLGLTEDDLDLYGKYKAKLDLTEIRKLPRKAKLILVTAISPTPAGVGVPARALPRSVAPAEVCLIGRCEDCAPAL